ncbi:uncharacterized protein LOC120454923 isoform X1 [Drosophila santomea]|uniref:uncharacterized protein LOC120454923 isoform X1 n=2 Tax=Drosophila santomea TaxID=129105 RepID=UPI001954E1C1|nr:uncharacterized protein LOC120454923 isoform X1 [Drosophila santomea]
MADRYASDLALVVVAQITQTIGYSCTLSAPLELLQDILQKFVQEFARDMHGQMEHANRIEPNLNDARLSIKNLSINVQELLDYIANVEPVGFIRDVPQFPIGKSVNMNFLKPGSAETLTRPVYIFEYLPPMQDPELREIPNEVQKEFSEKQEFCSKAEFNSKSAADKFGAGHIDSISPSAVMTLQSNAFDLDVGRSVREMSSVVMTTGGFLSPAIEGKLPEDFIPDIVEKFLGLDAPLPSSIIVNPVENSPSLAISERETSVNPRKIIPNQFAETKILTQNAALLTSAHLESSIINASNNHTMSTILTATTPKKNKNKKHNLGLETGKSENIINPFEKSLEKSQRKALKMYQETSKIQSSQMQNVKKSKKRLNRGSSDPNKKHFEKLKKQSKHKQKNVQLDIDEKPFLQNSQITNGFAIEGNSNTENDLQADILRQPTSAINQIENKLQSSNNPVQPCVIQNSQVLLPAKKTPSEPERSKLDVFKKFSKPRTPRQDSGGTSVPLGIGVCVFGSTMTTPPLISLPSGTTITPTPLLGINSEDINISSMKFNPCGIFDQTLPLTKADVEMSIIDSAKPKKRGRKPGGKNVIKHTNFVSQSLVDSVERRKSSQAITLPLASSPMLITQSSLNVSPPTEPLNLCNTEQPSSDFLEKLYTKDKKEKKKYKSKHGTCLPENEMEYNKGRSPEKTSALHDSIRATKQNTDAQCPDKFSIVSSASTYPGNQTGMVPLLPLLQFPPRPGLIPTGPGLFPAVSGLVGFGNHGNTVPISPFIEYPGPEGSAADTARCPPIKDSTVADTAQYLSRSSTQTDLQMDRNYCNVAPLVPDSMKFTECKSVSCASTSLEKPSAQATSKMNTKPLKQASGDPDDPIEVSDDSDESLHNRQMVQRKPPISCPTYTSFAESQTSSIISATFIGEEKSNMELRNINSNESIKKFKKPVKLSFPDVKSVTHTPSPPSFSQFNLPNFMGGDKFSLAGGADLIPLSRTSSSANSSKIAPFSSLGESNTLPNQMKISEEHHILSTFSNYDDITITPTGLTALEPKMRKHHKKLKKVKEGKIKKKKEKKDKSKRKDRFGLPSFKSDRKIKANDKRQKKEKKKDKDKQILVHIPDDKKEFTKVPLTNIVEPVLKSSSMTINPPLGGTSGMSPKLPQSPNQIPKLTLKLSGKPTLFSSSENEMTDAGKLKQTTIFPLGKKDRERDTSPELARFSPLVTGPPKNKQSDTLLLGNCSSTALPVPSTTALRNAQLPINQSSSNSAGWLSNPSNCNAASSTLSASSVLLPQQLMLAPNTIMNNFVQVIGNSTGTVSKSALCGSPLNISEENANAMQITEPSRPSSYVDAEGNRIWICPACGKVDDGSAMIGCDGCDAWYHWICVGITFAPKDNDDWFCRVCATKKTIHGSEKKKRRNKKK